MIGYAILWPVALSGDGFWLDIFTLSSCLTDTCHSAELDVVPLVSIQVYRCDCWNSITFCNSPTLLARKMAKGISICMLPPRVMFNFSNHLAYWPSGGLKFCSHVSAPSSVYVLHSAFQSDIIKNVTTAKSSLSVTQQLHSILVKRLLARLITCFLPLTSCCDSTAAMPVSLASVLMKNGFDQSSKAMEGKSGISLIVWKLVHTMSSIWTVSFFSHLMKQLSYCGKIFNKLPILVCQS